jgi:dTDP-4-amino-4,6-dideoxygalactose transaminase
MYHVGRPNIGNRKSFLTRINHILDCRWLTNDGAILKLFEKRIAAFLGVQHCVAVCNGTVALEIAARAMDLQGEVIVPSFTFVATAHALQWQGITPVFCDVVRGGIHIDAGQVERLLTPRTTGIVGVHTFGQPCNVDGLARVAKRHGLKLMLDAAHAFGCTYRGRKVGGFGDCEILSFHATKVVNAFEGGAIVTNDGELAKRARFMRNFGFSGEDDVQFLGINGKMSEAHAAMGLTSLEAFDQFVAVNQRNYELYRNELSALRGVALIEYDERESNNYHYIVVQVNESEAGISRDDLVEALHERGVLARRYFYPGCHQMEPYKSLQPNAGLLLPETEKLVQQVMALPTGTAVSENAVRRICQLIKDYAR